MHSEFPVAWDAALVQRALRPIPFWWVRYHLVSVCLSLVDTSMLPAHMSASWAAGFDCCECQLCLEAATYNTSTTLKLRRELISRVHVGSPLFDTLLACSTVFLCFFGRNATYLCPCRAGKRFPTELLQPPEFRSPPLAQVLRNRYRVHVLGIKSSSMRAVPRYCCCCWCLFHY